MQTVLHGVDGVEEVSAHAVELVDEGDAGDAVGRGLTPDGLGLRLDAGDGVEDRDRAVEDAQAALDLGGEVDVTRGVDDLDDVVLPEARGGGGGDGNAALLLLNHPVHGGGAIVDLTDLVGLAGVVEDALRRGGLTGVDVGHDADVAEVLELVLNLCHVASPRSRGLEAVVREGAVGLGHLEEVLATLHGSAHAVGGVEDLVGKTLGHGLLLAGTGEVDHPADGELGGTTELTSMGTW